ncbi:MAG: thioredoxin family protein [Polaribacter sp.]|uniref:thioredoxin family protein n=1 Tax=Polaribacter sp. TaxID=1920175 RepID=UPI003BB09027
MNKRVFFLLACFIIILPSSSQEAFSENIDLEKKEEIILKWQSNYAEALKKSKEENKPVLIYFTGSDWCGPCKVLDEKLFHTEKFKELSDKSLILLEVDIPHKLDLLTPEKIKENFTLQLDYKVKSFPTLLMVNYKGKKLAEKSGYVLAEYYYPFFESVIQKY